MTERLAPVVAAGSWQHAFAQQPFKRKLTWLRNLAAAAIAATLCVNVVFGAINKARLSRIEHGSYPLIQASWSLDETLTDLQRTLQDAVAAADTARLAAADSMTREFRSYLAGLSVNPIVDRERLSRLTVAFDSYYSLARPSTVSLVERQSVAGMLPALTEMQRGYNALRDTVDALQRDAGVAMDETFSS